MTCWTWLLFVTVFLCNFLESSGQYSTKCPAGDVFNVGLNTCEAEVEDKTKSAGVYKCLEGYTLIVGSKTCVKVYSQNKMNYDDAREVCKQQEGGDLVIVENIATNQFIAGLLPKGQMYWIGVKRHAYNHGSWTNLDGHPQLEAPWNRGEPNNFRGHEDCVEMIANKGGKWNDKRCSKKRPFVCQAPVYLLDLVSCDFETVCVYSGHQRPNGWDVVTNSTEPDHSGSKTSHYIRSSGKDKDALEVLIPFNNVFGYSCLTFWFRGNGGSVSVERVKWKTSTQKKTITSYTQGKEWEESQMTLNPLLRTEFKIQITIGQHDSSGNYGYDYNMLDDVLLTPGRCKRETT